MKEAFGRIDDVRIVNEALFTCLHFSEAFYTTVAASRSLSQLAYVDGTLAGVAACYVTNDRDAGRDIFIDTFGVIEKFRLQGVGSKLMRHVINTAKSDPYAKRLVLNVEIHNEKAIRFYKRFGFEAISLISGISGAWVMELRIGTTT